MWHDGDWSGWDWTAMAIMMVAFWGFLIAVLIWLVRGVASRPNNNEAAETDNPEELLARRFARGEIDKEEFESFRAVLDQHQKLR